jgi:acetyl-CoA carboxylase carboxyltransferase component
MSNAYVDDVAQGNEVPRPALHVAGPGDPPGPAPDPTAHEGPHPIAPDGAVAPPAPAAPMTLRRLTEENEAERRRAHDGPAGATERQRAKGRGTARERLDRLFDPDTFVEIDVFARHHARGFGIEQNRPFTDGVVTGWGEVDGRQVFAFAHDARMFGGSLGAMMATKIQKIMDLALSVGAPIVGLNDGAGARIQEGVDALDGYGGIFRRNVKAAGVIPQISVVLGPCAGGAVYSPALTDFVIMVEKTSNMFITGPDVVRSVTGEDVTPEELGGARTHATRTGVAAFMAPDEDTAIDLAREVLAYLPTNNLDTPPRWAAGDDPGRRCERLLDLVPVEGNRPYDMRQVLAEVVDDGELLEVFADFAANVVCTFARIDGHPVGIVANQPLIMAGTLDIDASEKAARFVRTCDAFNVPVVTFVDVPGFLPGTEQEHAGMIRHGAKLLYAYCEATVPRIQMIVRKAFGGAYIVMDSASVGADLSFAWPTNQVAVMGADGAASIVFRKQIAAAEAAGQDPVQAHAELTATYTEELMHRYAAAERGYVDDVIDPAETRSVLARALNMLRTKKEDVPQRKHGTIPL